MEREAWEPEMETEDTDSSKRFEWAPAVGVGVKRVKEGLAGAEIRCGMGKRDCFELSIASERRLDAQKTVALVNSR